MESGKLPDVMCVGGGRARESNMCRMWGVGIHELKSLLQIGQHKVQVLVSHYPCATFHQLYIHQK